MDDVPLTFRDFVKKYHPKTFKVLWGWYENYLNSEDTKDE